MLVPTGRSVRGPAVLALVERAANAWRFHVRDVREGRHGRDESAGRQAIAAERQLIAHEHATHRVPGPELRVAERHRHAAAVLDRAGGIARAVGLRLFDRRTVGAVEKDGRHALAAETKSEIALVLGNTILLYRPDPMEPRIELP